MSVWGRVREWWRATDPAPRDLDDESEAAHRHLIDANTRSFWSRGSSTPATLIETDAAVTPGTRSRLATLLDTHERGAAGIAPDRPRANPAFSEAVFVELMRAHRYDRAFELLAPDCQERWGSSTRFAKAQERGALRHLQGVRVTAARRREAWVDPETGITYPHVAELDAEYRLDNGRRSLVVPRTVHLVAVDGKWRSLCYPEPALAPA